MTVELYHGGPASNGLKALLALHEKGIAFEPRFVDLHAFEQHAPEYLKINPAGQVPTLVHDGRALTESTVIAEYVDAVFDGPPLRPADEYQRARMRIWTKYVDEVFRPALSFLAWEKFIPALARRLPEGEFEKRLERIPLPEKREKWALAAKGGFTAREVENWRSQLEEATGRVEAGLEGSDYLIGEMPTLADYSVFAMSCRMADGHPKMVNPVRTPRMLAWIDRMMARPGVQAAMAVPTPGRD